MKVIFNDTATTEIYTLSLHDALPICRRRSRRTAPPRAPAPWGWPPSSRTRSRGRRTRRGASRRRSTWPGRSEEHTSELQSRQYLVCRLLLEKKQIHLEYHNNID